HSWGSSSAEVSYRLPLSGTYFIVVDDQYADHTFPYNLTLQKTESMETGPYFSPVSGSVAYDQTLNSTTTTIQPVHNISFNGTVGDRIDARLQASWERYPRLTLY